MSIAETSTLEFEPITGILGAQVHGLDVHTAEPSQVGATLVRALHEHGVLFFQPERAVSLPEFKRLGSCFGELLEYPYTFASDLPGVNKVDSEEFPAVEYRTNRWHTDGSTLEFPPQAALLTPAVLPSVGGDTMWASMYAAWDAARSRFQYLLQDLQALHTSASLLRHYTEGQTNIFGDGASCVHPVVLQDPVTMRRMLYVNSNYTERIIGLKDSESEKLLAMLFEHINTPEFHVRLRWTLTTIAVWEERVTQHRAVADYNEPRTLNRITIRGERPRV